MESGSRMFLQISDKGFSLVSFKHLARFSGKRPGFNQEAASVEFVMGQVGFGDVSVST
jgi:hypothetical protein